MLPLTQQLKGWRHLCSLHHYYYHHRLLTFSASKSKSENSIEQGNSFGRLAESIKEKESNNSSQKFFKHHRDFPKPVQLYSDSWKDSSGLSQDNFLDKQHQFRDVEYQETLATRGNVQQDDAGGDYQYFVSKRTLGSLDQGEAQWEISDGKDSSQKAAASLKEVSTDISSNRGNLQNSAKKGEIFRNLNPQSEEPESDGDLREERYQNAKLERKHRPAFYGFKMKKLCKEKKVSLFIYLFFFCRIFKPLFPAGLKDDQKGWNERSMKPLLCILSFEKPRKSNVIETLIPLSWLSLLRHI